MRYPHLIQPCPTPDHQPGAPFSRADFSSSLKERRAHRFQFCSFEADRLYHFFRALLSRASSLTVPRRSHIWVVCCLPTLRSRARKALPMPRWAGLTDSYTIDGYKPDWRRTPKSMSYLAAHNIRLPGPFASSCSAGCLIYPSTFFSTTLLPALLRLHLCNLQGSYCTTLK